MTESSGKNDLYIGRWVYHKPSLIPNEKGNVVIVSKVSFGPLEAYEWGIDSGGNPYETYKWCENDFFEHENYYKNITAAELKLQTRKIIRAAESCKLSDWIVIYRKANELIERAGAG